MFRNLHLTFILGVLALAVLLALFGTSFSEEQAHTTLNLNVGRFDLNGAGDYNGTGCMFVGGQLNYGDASASAAFDVLPMYGDSWTHGNMGGARTLFAVTVVAAANNTDRYFLAAGGVSLTAGTTSGWRFNTNVLSYSFGTKAIGMLTNITIPMFSNGAAASGNIALFAGGYNSALSNWPSTTIVQFISFDEFGNATEITFPSATKLSQARGMVAVAARTPPP